MLLTNRTPQAAVVIEGEFDTWDQEDHHAAEAVWEAGRWWIKCQSCGAKWSVKEQAEKIDFAEAEQGDGYCSLMTGADGYDGPNEDDDTDALYPVDEDFDSGQ